MLNVFPGRRNISFMHIMPTGPETTRSIGEFFLEDERPNAEEQAAMDYVKQVLQPEDIGLVESVQRGLHSKGYTQGRFVVIFTARFVQRARRTPLSIHVAEGHERWSPVTGAAVRRQSPRTDRSP